jgi:hypothetical protein
MASETRRQERLATAYLATLELAADMTRWATEIRPIMDTDPPREVAPLPGTHEQQRVWALLAAYGSEAVRCKFDEFREAIRAVVRVHFDMALAEKARADAVRSPTSPLELWPLLNEELRPAVVARREELGCLVSRELGHSPGPDVVPESS